MKCPDCNEKMEIVYFRYNGNSCIPDDVKRYMCLTCGYQEVKKWWKR